VWSRGTTVAFSLERLDTPRLLARRGGNYFDRFHLLEPYLPATGSTRSDMGRN
jgi:hypothetical protein